MRNTNYGDTELAAIAEAKGLKNIQKLLIEGCINITDQGLEYIVSAKEGCFTEK